MLGDFAQYTVIVRRLVARHSAPVHRSGCRMGFSKTRNHVVVPAHCVVIFLVHERNAAEAAFESSNEIIIGQVAFQANPFLAFAVQEKYRRSPDRVEAMEPARMLLDVGFYGKKILMDEVCGVGVFVRLGLQPSTSASRRCGAEIEQDGPLAALGFA